MHKILKEIITKTQEDIRKIKQPSKVFMNALKNPNKGSVAIIAEIKLASPTAKNLGKSKDVKNRAKEYETAGADCISVVTEKHFFNGDLKYIAEIKRIVSLPILQKDFVIDPYQVYQAKQIGADAILLIARILSDRSLITLVNLAHELGLEPVVEINSQHDLNKALKTRAEIIAVNARDLDTLTVDVDRACELLKSIPDKFIKLGFSGIHSRAEVEKYKHAGANGVLIGTSLMKAGNILKFLEGISV